MQNKITAQALADSAQALLKSGALEEAKNLLHQAGNLDADRSAEFQAQINQIEQARQFAENKTKAAAPVTTKEFSPLSTPQDTSEMNTAINRFPGVSNDSLGRQPSKAISENGNLPSALKWAAAVVVTFLVIILVAVLIKKYRKLPGTPPPPPTELSQPAPMRDLKGHYPAGE